MGSKQIINKRTRAGCGELQCTSVTIIPTWCVFSRLRPGVGQLLGQDTAPPRLWYWCPSTLRNESLLSWAKCFQFCCLLASGAFCWFVCLSRLLEFQIFPECSWKNRPKKREFIERMLKPLPLYSGFSTTGSHSRWAVTNGFTLCSLSAKGLFRWNVLKMSRAEQAANFLCLTSCPLSSVFLVSFHSTHGYQSSSPGSSSWILVSLREKSITASQAHTQDVSCSGPVKKPSMDFFFLPSGVCDFQHFKIGSTEMAAAPFHFNAVYY